MGRCRDAFFRAAAFFLREQWAAAECEGFVCSELRDSERKLTQLVLSRAVHMESKMVLYLISECMDNCNSK